MKLDAIGSYYLFLACSFLNGVIGAKIVFLFGGGNVSHKLGVWPFVIGLAERGHHVTFFSSSQKQMQAHPNVIDIAPAPLVKATESAYGLDRFKQREDGEDLFFEEYADLTVAMCRVVFTERDDPDLLNMLENGDYDLAIVNTAFGECGILIAQYHGWKYINYSPTTILPWFHDTYGLPWQGSYIPMPTVKWARHPMGFIDRIQNVLAYWKWSSRQQRLNEGLEQLLKDRFGLSTVPAFMDMERNASLVFYGSHHATDFGRPLPPNIIAVGGMQCLSKVGVLPKNFQDFMDNAADGVVLIAFGSTVELNNLTDYYLQIFFNMMRKFNEVRFIWRWKGEMPTDAPENLMAADWLPQREILNHPNLRAFMTHCGMNSVIEATCFGVPLIGTPLFADQDYSAYRLEAQEVGVKLEIKGLTQERMNGVVEKILTNPKYKKNMVARSRILRDQPLNPVETAIYWAEFVLRHNDTSSFKPMALDQPVYVRLMLDAFFTIAFLIMGLPLAIMYCVILCIRKVVS